jgi:hypothetical protein
MGKKNNEQRITKESYPGGMPYRAHIKAADVTILGEGSLPVLPQMPTIDKARVALPPSEADNTMMRVAQPPEPMFQQKTPRPVYILPTGKQRATILDDNHVRVR